MREKMKEKMRKKEEMIWIGKGNGDDLVIRKEERDGRKIYKDKLRK